MQLNIFSKSDTQIVFVTDQIDEFIVYNNDLECSQDEQFRRNMKLEYLMHLAEHKCDVARQEIHWEFKRIDNLVLHFI